MLFKILKFKQFLFNSIFQKNAILFNKNDCIGLALDGFVLEVKGETYCRNLEMFSRTVYFMLRALCDLEDEHCGCMRRTTIGEYGWCKCFSFIFFIIIFSE